MKTKILIALLIVASLFGYLEWGMGNHTFLIAIEWEVLSKLFTDPKSVAHPFIFIPLFGQLLLLITLFQKTPRKKWIYAGMACIGLLLVFMLVVGILGKNLKIIASTIPFILTCIYVIRYFKTVST
ncbi:MAG: hypothetical protein IPK35_01505 [Saprospiraceae bacterium]|nr:hypothetical protein [Saprospiraceae bacterium]